MDTSKPRGTSWPTGLIMTAALICALAGMVLLILVVTEAPLLTDIDRAINTPLTEWSRDMGWPTAIAAAWGAATGPVPTTVVAVLGVLILLITRNIRWAVLVATSALLGVVVAEALKVLVARQRPPGAEEYEHDLMKSFPSGHAMASIYVYGCIALILFLAAKKYRTAIFTWLGIIVIVSAATIGLSRLVLGVHWVSDVLAGWLFGATVLLVATAVVHPERTDWPGPDASGRDPSQGPQGVAPGASSPSVRAEDTSPSAPTED